MMLRVMCKFGDQCDMQISIRLICGCHNRDTQVRLLAMPEEKLDEVVKLMQVEERACGYQSTMKKPPQQVSFTRDARGRNKDARRNQITATLTRRKSADE